MGDTIAEPFTQRDILPICHIVTPVGMLGYGFNFQQTRNALLEYTNSNVPTAIILDSGSTDSGPDKLALGSMTCPRSSYARDLTNLLKLVHEFHVPLIFSSAGGDGSDEHVREMLRIIHEICEKEGNENYRFKTLAIFSEIKKSLVFDRLRSTAITGCGKSVPALTEEDINAVPLIVSQMGPEPFIDAMNANPDFDVIVGGRAYDPAPYVAYAAFIAKTPLSGTASPEAQRLWGGLTHMGKIMECGGACAKPKSSGASATMYGDGSFDITPSDPQARCTSTSVAAHGLYEKSRPDILSGPGGYLDLTRTRFEELDDGRTLRVRGAVFTFLRDVALKYQVKLEAASVIGYRAMYMGSFKDPTLIGQLDDFLGRIKTYVSSQHDHIHSSWKLDFHTYGRDSTSTLPEHSGEPSEVFLIGEALAETKDVALSVVSSARIATIHGSYPGQKATSGNFAFGLGGKTGIELGPCSKFSIYHLMDLEIGEERLHSDQNTNALFSQTVEVIGHGKEIPRKTAGEDFKPAVIESTASPTQATNGTKDTKDTPNDPLLTTETQQSTPRTLGDLASVLRSKNSGPYELTFDVLFDSEATYRLVKESSLLQGDAVANALGVQRKDIIWHGFFDQALAFKITIPRIRNGQIEPNGGYMENDVHGSQKYLGLYNLKLDEGFVERLTTTTTISG